MAIRDGFEFKLFFSFFCGTSTEDVHVHIFDTSYKRMRDFSYRKRWEGGGGRDEKSILKMQKRSGDKWIASR